MVTAEIMLHCAQILKLALTNTQGWIKMKWAMSAGKWLPPLLSGRTFPSLAIFYPIPDKHCSSFPHPALPMSGMVSNLLSLP